MSEEVQESVGDYLELERYIEQLRLQRSACLPDNLAPQQTRIYSMALLFHTASPHEADLRPEFIVELGQRLREQQQAEEQSSGLEASNPTPSPQNQKQFRTIFRQDQAAQSTSILPTRSASTDAKREIRQDEGKRRARFSRRKVATLAAEFLVAAGIGAGAGAVIEHAIESNPSPPPGQNTRLTGDNWQWQTVASVEQLGQGVIPFTTGTITGYLISQPEDKAEPIIALSAACTHLGCTVQWQKVTQEFVCPCHGSIFDATGAGSAQNRQPYAPLPRLDTKTEDGQILVKVPFQSSTGLLQ